MYGAERVGVLAVAVLLRMRDGEVLAVAACVLCVLHMVVKRA